MNKRDTLGLFWRGRVVVITGEDSWENNLGHVVGFVKEGSGEVLIRVDFANGDRYDVLPEELEPL